MVEKPPERCNADLNSARRVGAAFSKRNLSDFDKCHFITHYRRVYPPRLPITVKSTSSCREREGANGGSRRFDYSAKSRDKWEPVNFHISRATPRVYAVASRVLRKEKCCIRCGSRTLYRRRSTGVDSNLKFGACNPTTPRSGDRSLRKEDGIKWECSALRVPSISRCAAVFHVDYRPLPLSFCSSPIFYHPPRRVGKRLEVSNVKCKAQYYPVRRRPFASPTLLPLPPLYLSFSSLSLFLSFPILFLSLYLSTSLPIR